MGNVPKLLPAENGFHGRTFAAVTATAQPKYHAGLGPLVAGFRYAPYNDLQAIADLVDDETCAIMVEPIQGEGGVNIPDQEYLAGLRQLADEANCLLIFDEVSNQYGGEPEPGSVISSGAFNPDIMTMAKGIAAGVAAGAVIATEEVAPSLKPGMHAKHLWWESPGDGSGDWPPVR